MMTSLSLIARSNMDVTNLFHRACLDISCPEPKTILVDYFEVSRGKLAVQLMKFSLPPFHLMFYFSSQLEFVRRTLTASPSPRSCQGSLRKQITFMLTGLMRSLGAIIVSQARINATISVFHLDRIKLLFFEFYVRKSLSTTRAVKSFTCSK